MTRSLAGSPTKAKEAPSPHEVRLLCDKLFHFKHISVKTVSDNAEFEVDAILSTSVLRNRDKFVPFNFKKDRLFKFRKDGLDCFLKPSVHNNNNYENLRQ